MVSRATWNVNYLKRQQGRGIRRGGLAILVTALKLTTCRASYKLTTCSSFHFQRQPIWERRLTLLGLPGRGSPRSQSPLSSLRSSSLHPSIPAWPCSLPRTHCSRSRPSGPGSRPRRHTGSWLGCRCGWRGRQTGRGHRCLRGPWWLQGGRKEAGGRINILCIRSLYQLPRLNGFRGSCEALIRSQFFPIPVPEFVIS